MNYAETLPQSTMVECAVLEPLQHNFFRLNLRPPDELKFQQKAYDLFRVIDKENNTIDIIARVEPEVAAIVHHISKQT